MLLSLVSRVRAIFSVQLYGRAFSNLALVAAGFLSASVLADGLELNQRFTGFATFGIVTSDNPDLGFRRDIPQNFGSSNNAIEWRTDTMVGLQWQGSWSSSLDATVQVVAKDRYNDSIENSIEWAFLRYRPVDGLDLRVGRLGGDVFMVADYRHVGYALPWVRPPQDFYGLLSFYHFDGADITKRFDINGGTLNVKTFYGHSDEHYPGSDQTGPGVNLDFSIAGIVFNMEWDQWKARYTYSEVDMNNNMGHALTDALEAVSPLWPEANAIAQDINSQGKYIKYHALGAAYDNNIWWARSEFASLKSDTLLGPNSDYFYFSVGRRIADFTVYGLYGLADPHDAPPTYTAPAGYPSPLAEQLDMVAQGATVALLGINQDQHSVGLGVRWDFRPKMALKLQADRFTIDPTGTNLWMTEGPPLFAEEQKSTVLSLTMDVLF